jgi:hypothetical protein
MGFRGACFSQSLLAQCEYNVNFASTEESPHVFFLPFSSLHLLVSSSFLADDFLPPTCLLCFLSFHLFLLLWILWCFSSISDIFPLSLFHACLLPFIRARSSISCNFMTDTPLGHVARDFDEIQNADLDMDRVYGCRALSAGCFRSYCSFPASTSGGVRPAYFFYLPI